MAKDFTSNLKKKRDALQNSFVMNMQEDTKKSLDKLETSPTLDNLENAITIIENDSVITEAEKKEILKEINQNYGHLFTFDNCPTNNYSALKDQAKFLYHATRYNFLLYAQRVKAIRDFQYYKTEDKYQTFEEFIEKEIKADKSGTYKYINLIEYFETDFYKSGSASTFDPSDFEATKLFPILPLMKSKKITDKEKENIKKDFFSRIQHNESWRQIQEEAKKYKIKYNLIAHDNVQTTLEIESDLNKILKKLNKDERNILANAAKFLGKKNLIEKIKKLNKEENVDGV